jgi:phosphoribosyl 1,2-cyclic phosphodiesterase
MGLRFASLGSGSAGNALVVEACGTRVLMDCGFTIAETSRRLGRLGLAPQDLDAVLVTHEHSDHLGGVPRFAARHGLPVHLTRGTSLCLPAAFPAELIRMVDPHAVFAIGELQVDPIAVPHDAREPVQYAFSDGNSRLGVATDLGCGTPHVEEKLSGCDALVLECNHDRGLLEAGSYPRGLKERISGRLGHLENAAAAGILARLDRSRLHHVIAAHLSRENNSPALAAAALASVLGCAPDEVGVASQEEGFGWREI